MPRGFALVRVGKQRGAGCRRAHAFEGSRVGRSVPLLAFPKRVPKTEGCGTKFSSRTSAVKAIELPRFLGCSRPPEAFGGERNRQTPDILCHQVDTRRGGFTYLFSLITAQSTEGRCACRLRELLEEIC